MRLPVIPRRVAMRMRVHMAMAWMAVIAAVAVAVATSAMQGAEATDAVGTPLYPPSAIHYHAQGRDETWEPQPRLSPDKKFLCASVAVAARGAAIHCWRMKSQDSADAGAEDAGPLHGDGAVVRANIPTSGTTSVLRSWNFAADGRAILVAVGVPARIWHWERDVDSGALANPRVIWTLSESSGSFAPYISAFHQMGPGGAIVAWSNRGTYILTPPPPSTTTQQPPDASGAGPLPSALLYTSTELGWEDPQYAGSGMKRALASVDGQCVYVCCSVGGGVCWFRLLADSNSTGRTSPLHQVDPLPGLPAAASSVHLSRDAAQTRLFAVSPNSVAVWTRNASDCSLSLLAYFDGVAVKEQSIYVGFSGLTLFADQRRILVGVEYVGPGRILAPSLLELVEGGGADGGGGGGGATGSGVARLEWRGILAMPPGPVSRLLPFLSADERHVLMFAGAAELFSVPTDALLSTLQPPSPSAPEWPHALSGQLQQIQTGYWGDQAFAVATADARFLYSTGAVTDFYRFTLDPLTGARTDGGRRYFTNSSQSVQRSNGAYLAKFSVLKSIALSVDAEEKFLFAGGLELHSMQRNTSSGALFNRRIFPLAPRSASGWGAMALRALPFPQLLLVDGQSLCAFRIDNATGEVIAPPADQDGSGGGAVGRGVVMTLSSPFTVISAVAADDHVVYVGSNYRTVTVLARSAATGAISNATLQVLSPSSASPAVSLVALLLRPGFLYSFDDGGSLLVYMRDGQGRLTFLQSAPPLLQSGQSYGFTGGAALWSNRAQDVLVAGLQNSELYTFRRNAHSGLLDSPLALVPPAQTAGVFRLQGRVLSVTVAGGTVYATAAAASSLPGATLLEFSTDNFVPLSRNGTDSGDDDQADGEWPAEADWAPAMRLQLLSAGSPYDGQYISFRPDPQSAPWSMSPLGRCGRLMSNVLPVGEVLPGAAPTGCSVPAGEPVNVGTPCSGRIAISRSCSVSQMVRNVASAGGSGQLLVAPAVQMSLVEAADPGLSDAFEEPVVSAEDVANDRFFFAANNRISKMVLHIDAMEGQRLSSMVTAAGCTGLAQPCVAKFFLPPLPTGSDTEHTPQSLALWRLASLSSWTDERFGLRQYLPVSERGSVRLANWRSAFVPSAVDVEMPNACWGWLPGVYCEGDDIVSLSWIGYRGSLSDGSLPDVFDGLPHLQSLRLVDSPVRGSLPPSICRLRRLRYLHIERTMLTALPDCFGTDVMLTLQHFHVSESPVAQLPHSISRATRLTWLNFAHNHADAERALPDITALRRLVSLNLTSAGFVGNVTRVRPSRWKNLAVYALDGNALSGPITADWFDGLSLLRRVSLAGNSLSGPFPAFLSATGLLSLSFAGCGLSGGLPAQWSQLTVLTSLDLSGNELRLPIAPMSAMTSLSFADLSNNRLECGGGGLLDDLLSLLPVSVQTLRLDGNPLTQCAWRSAVSSLAQSPLLQALTASHTGVTELPEDLFAPALPWRLLDFSSCRLSVGLSQRYPPSSTLLSLSLSDNPNITAPAGGRPAWLLLDASQLQRAASELFSCPTARITTNAAALLQLPPQYSNYEQCACLAGTFGSPPLCRMQLSEVEMSAPVGAAPSDFTLPSVGAPAADQLLALWTNGEAGATAQLSRSSSGRRSQRLTGAAAAASRSPTARSARAPAASAAVGSSLVVTDSWFGSDRSTPGVNSDFVFRAPAGTRVVRLIALVNRQAFTQRSDVLSVRADQSAGERADDDAASAAQVLQGNAVQLPTYDLCASEQHAVEASRNISALVLDAAVAARASVLLSAAVDGAPLDDSAYVSGVRASLSTFCAVSVWVVDVAGSSASLNFRSKSPGGAFFVAMWTSSTLCPQGLEADPDSQRCLRRYQMAPPVQISALVLAAAMAAALLLVAGVLVWCRHLTVIRTASLPLQLSLVLCLLALCAGAALHTVSPASVSDDGVCLARAWLTLLPIGLILAALFARASHVTAIFESQGLRAQDPWRSARWVAAAGLVELALLIPFSAVPLSSASLTVQASLPDRLILECGGGDGFWLWFGVQLAFLVLLLLPSVRVAFRARKLPLLFNESASLFNGLVVLALCGLTVIPAAVGVSGTAVPEAAQAVSAFGQLMLVALWSVTLIGPKLMQLRREQRKGASKKQQTTPPLVNSAPQPLRPDAPNVGEQMASQLPSRRDGQLVQQQQVELLSAMATWSSSPDECAEPLSKSAAAVPRAVSWHASASVAMPGQQLSSAVHAAPLSASPLSVLPFAPTKHKPPLAAAHPARDQQLQRQRHPSQPVHSPSLTVRVHLGELMPILDDATQSGSSSSSASACAVAAPSSHRFRSSSTHAAPVPPSSPSAGQESAVAPAAPMDQLLSLLPHRSPEDLAQQRVKDERRHAFLKALARALLLHADAWLMAVHGSALQLESSDSDCSPRSCSTLGSSLVAPSTSPRDVHVAVESLSGPAESQLLQRSPSLPDTAPTAAAHDHGAAAAGPPVPAAAEQPLLPTTLAFAASASAEESMRQCSVRSPLLLATSTYLQCVDEAMDAALEFEGEGETATAVAPAPAPAPSPLSTAAAGTAGSGLGSVSGVHCSSSSSSRWDPRRLAQLVPSGLVVALLSHQWEFAPGPAGGFASLRRRLAELSPSTLTPAQSEALHAFVTRLQRSLRAPCQRLLSFAEPHAHNWE